MAEEPTSSDLVLVDATNLLLPSTEKFLCRFWENVSDYFNQESIMVLIIWFYILKKKGDWWYHIIINISLEIVNNLQSSPVYRWFSCRTWGFLVGFSRPEIVPAVFPPAEEFEPFASQTSTRDGLKATPLGEKNMVMFFFVNPNGGESYSSGLQVLRWSTPEDHEINMRIWRWQESQLAFH